VDQGVTAVARSVLSLVYRLRGFTCTSLLVHVPVAEPAIAVLGGNSEGDVPAHVTVAYPFTLTAMGARASAELAQLFAEHPAFDVEFHAVRRFDDDAYLAPREPLPFAALATAVQDRFPGNPLYGGAFGTYTPHVTIGPVHRLTSAALQAVERLLPLHAQVREVELWGFRGSHWVRVRGFDLAAPPPAN